MNKLDKNFKIRLNNRYSFESFLIDNLRAKRNKEIRETITGREIEFEEDIEKIRLLMKNLPEDISALEYYLFLIASMIRRKN